MERIKSDTGRCTGCLFNNENDVCLADNTVMCVDDNVSPAQYYIYVEEETGPDKLIESRTK